MITKFKILFNIMLLALVVGFTACDGDKGSVGPKGDNGIAGDPGTVGDKGEKGDQTAEALTFGNVVTTISGKTPEGADFTQTIDFDYLLDGLYNSRYTEYSEGIQNFNIGRENKVDVSANGKINPYQGNSFEFQFSKEDDVYTFKNLYVNTAILIDKEYFTVQLYEYFQSDNDFTITNYSFDQATGALKFDFSYSFTDYNDSSFTITGTADLIIVKSIDLG